MTGASRSNVRWKVRACNQLSLFIFAGVYKTLLRPLLFQTGAENAHRIALTVFRAALGIPGYGVLHDRMVMPHAAGREIHVAGMDFKHPVGLAAGFDKNAEYIPLTARLGFSHIEIGTVTPKPQEGNLPPRLFRLPADQALINRMGFNNAGAEAVARNLSAKKTRNTIEKYRIRIGGNIGRNKMTANAEAWRDYVTCFEHLYAHVDYFTINISSPNTPGLRDLQEKEPLEKILSEVQEHNMRRGGKPVFLKISPDLSETQMDVILENAVAKKLSGIIATNTTIRRDALKTPQSDLDSIGEGGLSGKPLFSRSHEVLEYLRAHSPENFVLVASGGIFSSADLSAQIAAGASLVQVYTGLIYEGPALVKHLLAGLP